MNKELKAYHELHQQGTGAIAGPSGLAASLAIFTIGFLIWGALFGAIVLVPWSAARFVLGIFLGLSTATLFAIGHDACHSSFTGVLRLNRILGTLAFLPSLTPFSTWQYSHSLHHAFTNLKPYDFLWAPMSKQEFDKLPAWRQLVERFYRTPVGILAYYFIEIWLKWLFFPNKRFAPFRRPDYVVDSLVVLAFGVLWIAALAILANLTRRSMAELTLCGFVAPTITWNAFMSFCTYHRHTSPWISWYEDPAEWNLYSAQLSGVFRTVFPRPIDSVLNPCMYRAAHHLNVAIPIWKLNEAQKALEVIAARKSAPIGWSFIEFLRCIRRCKLYDFRERHWTDFDGRPTGIERPAIRGPLAGRSRAM